MAWRELTPQDLYGLRHPLIIDVRSPCEFAEERIPGAVNQPLLSDQERAEIGIIYKQEGEMNARRHSLKFIAPKIPTILDEVLALRKHEETVVIHCWRGGLRSEAVASVLSLAGINCMRLSGGYKAWRAHVLAELSNDIYPFDPIVLYGLTGTGKTDILEELQTLGAQVLDLESLANHRGSTFGGIGKGKQPSQKNFEADLWTRLRKLDSSKPVFIEAESRKIGRISLPDSILNRIKSGKAVLVEGSLEARTERILSAYWQCQDSDAATALQEAFSLLDMIKVRVGKKKCDHIRSLATQGQLSEVIEMLLVDYYDPLYRESTKKTQSFIATVSGDDAKASAKVLFELSQKDLPWERRHPAGL